MDSYSIQPVKIAPSKHLFMLSSPLTPRLSFLIHHGQVVLPLPGVSEIRISHKIGVFHLKFSFEHPLILIFSALAQNPAHYSQTSK